MVQVSYLRRSGYPAPRKKGDHAMGMVTPQELGNLCGQLNAYAATHTDPTTSNIWQDVILTHPLYSESGTDAVDRGDSTRFALVDGTTLVWSAQDKRWQRL